MRLTNFSGQSATVPLKFTFEADFADIFEVQGHRRAKRGAVLEPELYPDGVRLAYRGLDERLRTTQVRFSAPPLALAARQAAFTFDLASGSVAEVFIEIGMSHEAAASGTLWGALRA